jgi:hypothetical protein
MPLKKGPHSIGANLKKLKGEGYDTKQALAIALDIARGKKKKGGRRKSPAPKK